MDEELILQMGLLLTQVRFARRALEDLERNTAMYGGFSFLRQLTPEARFGEPPLFNGALKVYVVNINDLTASSPFGGFLEGLLGGVGRFFGGLAGGFVGGTIGGVALPYMLAQVNSITEKVSSIVDRLGIRMPTPEERNDERRLDLAERLMSLLEGRPATPPSAPAESNAGAGFLSLLPPLTDALLGLTALFRAAAAGPGEAGAGPTEGQTAALAHLERVLRPIYEILDGVSRVVDGLIILVPILTGAFASMLVRLNDVKLAFVEMLQFLLRNVFLLRGVVLVTVFDTLAAAARLAAGVLRVISGAVSSILDAVFAAVASVLRFVVEAIRFVLTAARDTINALIPWLQGTISAVLGFLASNPVFRLFAHIVQILPNILPALVRLVHNVSLTYDERTALAPALTARIPPPAAAGAAGVPAFPMLPDLAGTLLPRAQIDRLVHDVESVGTGLRTNTARAFQAAEGAILRIGRQLDVGGFESGLEDRMTELRDRAGLLADSLGAAQRAAATRPRTGLEEIATAYERWLEGGGLRALLGRITQHFQASPTTGPAAAASIPGRIVAETALERARATVEIDEVVVEIAPPAPLETAAVPVAAALPRPAWLDELELAERVPPAGGDPSLLWTLA